MALTTYSPSIADAIGPVQRVTYAHHRAGPTARLRSGNATPRTTPQMQQAARLHQAHTAWAALTAAQRAAWAAYAATLTHANRTGEPMTISGWSYYAAVATACIITANTPPTSPPPVKIILPPPTLIYAEAYAGSGEIYLYYDLTQPWRTNPDQGCITTQHRPTRPTHTRPRPTGRIIGYRVGNPLDPPEGLFVNSIYPLATDSQCYFTSYLFDRTGAVGPPSTYRLHIIY